MFCDLLHIVCSFLSLIWTRLAHFKIRKGRMCSGELEYRLQLLCLVTIYVL